MKIKELYGELFILMTHCACGDMDYISSTECAQQFQNMLDCLKKYANIEEELGIDLVTFHQALKNGVYYKVTDKSSINYGKIFFDRYILWGWNQNPDGTYFAIMQSQLQSFNLKDYDKTWALTRGELE